MSVFDTLLRTDLSAPSTVQTLILTNHNRLHSYVDAFLRTDRVTELTANAALSGKISGLGFLDIAYYNSVTHDF